MKDSARTIALSVGLGALAMYLAAHAVTGRQGLMAQWALQADEKALSAELAALQTERAALDARAARLRPESLDLDYLEERARALLAAGGSDEIVFTLDQES